MENPHDVLRFVLRCCSGICSSLIHRYNNIGYVNPKNFATSLYTIYIFENFGLGSPPFRLSTPPKIPFLKKGNLSFF